MPNFLIHVSTNWCGMDQTYAAIAASEDELYDIAEDLAYENFCDFGCREEIAEELFPEVEDGDYTDEMISAVDDAECDYYSYYIEEVGDNSSEFKLYDVVYGK